MRLLLTLASVLIISLLIFNQYPNGIAKDSPGIAGAGQQMDPIMKAQNVNLLVQDTANLQRQALEKQLQQ